MKFLTAILSLFLFIQISNATTTPAYKRKDWGSGWADLDRNCINTRHEVLKRDSLEPVQFDQKKCRIKRGKWEDFYTGEIITDPGQIDIDHVVPVAIAHRLTEGRWNRGEKKAFYNDLENLVVTSRQNNRSKGANDITVWQPANRKRACNQMKIWMQIKQKYRLSVSEKETEYEKLLECEKVS